MYKIQGFSIKAYLPIIAIGVIGYLFISKKEGSSILGMNEEYDKKSIKYDTLSKKYGKLSGVYKELFTADNKLRELKSNVKEIQ